MADDNDKKNDSDDKIATLFSKYKKEIEDDDFANAKNTYYNISKRIENSTLPAIDILIHKTKLLQNTNANILRLNFDVDNKLEILFSEQAKKFKDYLEYYWRNIDYKLFNSLSKDSINKINSSATSIIKAVEDVLHFQDVATIEVPAPIDKDNNESARYKNLTNAITQSIEDGMVALSSILPLFSIWGRRGEEIGKEVKEDKKIIEEKMKAIDEKIEAVEQMGTVRLLDKVSEQFEETAKAHSSNQIKFLRYAKLTAGVALGWGVTCMIILLFVTKESSIVYFLPSGLLISGVLIGCMYASLRAYFANAHSEAVNRQRHNAIQNYLATRKVLTHEHSDIFARKATEAAFEHVPTGFTKYHKEDSKSSDNSAQPALIAAAIAAAIRATTGGGGSGSGGSG